MKKNFDQHTGKILAKKNGFDVVQCEECGFAHLMPLPGEEELQQFYEKVFYDELWPNYIEKHQEEIKWMEIEFNEKFDFFDDHLAKNSPGKLLDIGSGTGFFIRTGKQRGWDVLGIEPGTTAFDFSSDYLNLPVKNCMFNESNYDSFGTFDVIHLNKVFEHLLNPHQILSMAYKILNPGGLICMTVPNDFNVLQMLAIKDMPEDCWWVAPDEHINYFTRESLENLLLSKNFNPVFTTAGFPLELFILMGDDYISQPDLGKIIHQKRKNFEQKMEELGKTGLKREIYNSLCNLGLGRELTVYAQRIDPKE